MIRLEFWSKFCWSLNSISEDIFAADKPIFMKTQSCDLVVLKLPDCFDSVDLWFEPSLLDNNSSGDLDKRSLTLDQKIP